MFNFPMVSHLLTLKCMEELKKFSCETSQFEKADGQPKTCCYCTNNGVLAFTDDTYGRVSVTPLRSGAIDILKEAGYRESAIYVPFSNGYSSEPLPPRMEWLNKIANEEWQAIHHTKAYRIATEKGIKPVEVKQEVEARELTQLEIDDTTKIGYYPIDTNNNEENIGTFIVVDDHFLVICDEYGRTFLVKTTDVVNNLVNAMIDAGYTRNAYPDLYIQQFAPSDPS